MAEPDERPDWFWELAIATNAVVKGVLGSLGQSGHICASVDPRTSREPVAPSPYADRARAEAPITSGWRARPR